MTHTAQPDPLPPVAQLVQMGMGHWISRVVYVGARLGLADHIGDGEATAADLARKTGTHPPSLARLLRTLASLGILHETGPQTFALTEVGAALRDDAPGAARASILTMASDWWVTGFLELTHSVATGRSGFEKSLGEPVFDWLAKHPDDARLFNQTMIGVHGSEPPAVAEAYDFSGAATIVDVGGGSGNLLTTILARHPSPRGILFDLPHVLPDAAALIAARGLSDRVTLEAGSFFAGVPSGGDVYVLSHVIHDWSEDQCLTILGHCRQAMHPGARLLLVEMVIPPGDTPHPGKILDMMMLVGPGGQERTEQEYAALLGKAGLQLTRVVPTASAVSVMEAAPA